MSICHKLFVKNTSMRKLKMDCAWNLEFPGCWHQRLSSKPDGNHPRVGKSPKSRPRLAAGGSTWAMVQDHRTVCFKDILDSCIMNSVLRSHCCFLIIRHWLVNISMGCNYQSLWHSNSCYLNRQTVQQKVDAAILKNWTFLHWSSLSHLPSPPTSPRAFRIFFLCLFHFLFSQLYITLSLHPCPCHVASSHHVLEG